MGSIATGCKSGVFLKVSLDLRRIYPGTGQRRISTKRFGRLVQDAELVRRANVCVLKRSVVSLGRQEDAVREIHRRFAYSVLWMRENEADDTVRLDPVNGRAVRVMVVVMAVAFKDRYVVISMKLERWSVADSRCPQH
jgi:hypothetical protein